MYLKLLLLYYNTYYEKIQILKILYSTFVEFNLGYLGRPPRTSNYKSNKIYIFEF